MMDEAYLIAKKAELLEIDCEKCGMVALNTYRESRQETIAYDDTHFESLAIRCRRIQADIWENR